MKMLSARKVYGLGFLAAAMIFGFTLYLQFEKMLEPCPLCELERIIMLAIGAVYLVAFAIYTRQRWLHVIYGALASAAALAGVITAGRHVWLQWYPPANAACGAGLNYLLQCMPVHDVVKKIFEGSAECTQVSCTFVGVTLTEWAFAAFVVFLLMSLWQMFRR